MSQNPFKKPGAEPIPRGSRLPQEFPGRRVVQDKARLFEHLQGSFMDALEVGRGQHMEAQRRFVGMGMGTVIHEGLPAAKP